MNRMAKLLLSAAMVPGVLATASVCYADDPIHAEDLVGKWKKNATDSISIGKSDDNLTLKTKVDDWVFVRYTEEKGVVLFEHSTTEKDIREAQNPPPESIVTDAAASGTLKQKFEGSAQRGSDRCKLTMNVTWYGWRINWDEAGKWQKLDDPSKRDKYAQVRYVLPDLRKVTVQTRFEAPALSEQDRVSAGTEIQDYFNDRAAMKLFGEFTLALFKPFFEAVNEAVPAESFLQKLGAKLLETAFEKGLQGDLSAKDFVKVVSGQVLDKILGAAAEREPIASIKTKLDKALGEDQVSKLTDKAKDAANDKIANALTKEDQVGLGDYLKQQCRYEMVSLPAHGAIIGGVALVDKQLGTAEFWLLIKSSGSRPTITAHGTMGNLPEEGATSGILTIHFNG
jgi:hypothetical protein